MTNYLARLSMVLLVVAVGLTWPAEAHAQKKVRFAYPSSADMGDIPSLLAWEQLKKQGIEVVPTFFPKTDLAVQAVVAGEADIGSAAGIAVVKAVESGMNIRIIGEQVRNEWQLVTPVSIKDVKQLDGKRVGYHAPITVTEALVKWMAQHYKTQPELDDHPRLGRARRSLDARPVGCDTGGDRRRVEYIDRQARPVSRLDLLRQDFSPAHRFHVLRPRRLRAKECRHR